MVQHASVLGRVLILGLRNFQSFLDEPWVWLVAENHVPGLQRSAAMKQIKQLVFCLIFMAESIREVNPAISVKRRNSARLTAAEPTTLA